MLYPIIEDNGPIARSFTQRTMLHAGGPGSGEYIHKKGPAKIKPLKPKILKNVYGKPIVSDRQKRALAARKPCGQKEHTLAEYGEHIVAQATGGTATKRGTNTPFDVMIKTKHGIEVKTMMNNSNMKITMKKSAMERKYKDAVDHGVGKIHTVIVDMTGKKIGDEPRAVYYREGVGSFRTKTWN